MITYEKVQSYKTGGGTRCLHCHSVNIEAGDFEANDTAVYRAVECMDCREAWEEVYKLSTCKGVYSNEG